MTITVDAVYENGTLKLEKPLPLREQEKVEVIIKPKTNWVQETAGMFGWKGSHEELEQLLAEAEELEDLP